MGRLGSYMDYNWDPLPDETPEDYVERVGGWKNANYEAYLKIKSHFGFDTAETRTLLLKSRSFWKQLFIDHVQGIFNRGGSRYAAVRYIQRKNEHLRGGNKIFSQQEIDDLIDSVGQWKK